MQTLEIVPLPAIFKKSLKLKLVQLWENEGEYFHMKYYTEHIVLGQYFFILVSAHK